MSVQASVKDHVSKYDCSNDLKDKLLVNDTLNEQDCEVGWQQEVNAEDSEDKVLPYSFGNEVRFFFEKGIPLGLSSFLEWGAPPWFAMIMAGHTPDSKTLQSALGYGRVFFYCTSLMILLGACNYFTTVVPGCIGAGRRDRIPHYLRRSLLLSMILMIPFFVLQFFAAPILLKCGVPSDITVEVGVYCRLMIITAILLIVEIHFENIFINLGYARSATFNSLVTGIGIDVICTYFFIYKLNLGMTGVGFAQIIVKGSRILVWLALMLYYGLFSTIFVATKKEVLLSPKEVKVFLKLSVPSILSNLSGWLIYELQIMAIANIHGISTSALAAGAIWVQSETTLAAVQNGWITVTMMRTLKLLGMKDPGAWKSYTMLCVFSELVVAAFNIPLLIWGEKLTTVVSNDPDVQRWFGKIIWVLALHSQLRIGSMNANVLFIPMGKAVFQIVLKIVCFYLIVSPAAVIVCLTDMVTNSVLLKLTFCLATTPMASLLIAMFEFGYLILMDWSIIAKIINDRANTDKEQIIS